MVTVVNNLSGGNQASGSGVIISSDGYIVTNNHVIDSARSLDENFADGSKVAAQLVGSDPYVDVAVLKVGGQVPAVASFGNSDALKPGETVIAIGSPLGDFHNTLPVRVVSAPGRSIDTASNYQMTNLVQTDAAINHGNSGGPLVDVAGQVIGISTLVIRGTGSTVDQAQGLGFAIPSNEVQATSQQLIQIGYVSSLDLGISWQSVRPDIAQAYIPPAQWGVYNTAVAAGVPSDKVGLRRGDIITKVGDTSLDDRHPFVNALWIHGLGETVTCGLPVAANT